MRGGRRQALTGVVLFGVCLGLGQALYDRLEPANDGLVIAPAPEPGRPGIVALTRQTPFRMPALSTLSEVAERPLFFEGRRRPVPPPVEKEKVDKPKPPGQVTLMGVVISPERSIALVSHPSSKSVLHVSVGQKIDAWNLESIHPDRIVLRWEDQVEEVRLEDNRPKTVRGRAGRPRPIRQRTRSRARPPNRAAPKPRR